MKVRLGTASQSREVEVLRESELIDTNDDDGAVYEADHEELQFKSYDPRSLPPIATLTNLA